MKSENIKPASGKHAIEIMAIGVEWDVPLEEVVLEELEEIYKSNEKIKKFLPAYSPVRALALNLGLPGNFTAEDRSDGFDLRQFDADGNPVWAISVRPQLISCNCMAYDRWRTVKPQAIELLTPFVQHVLQSGKIISAIGLQYQDAFSIAGEISEAKLTDLFRENSKWIPFHLFEKNSLWHCHQGWFSSSPDGRRTLNNFNLDIHELNSNYVAKINGQHRAFSIGSDGETSRPIGLDAIDPTLEFLHGQNKDALQGVLSDEMLTRIGFTMEG